MKIKNVFYIMALFGLQESFAPQEIPQAQPIMCFSLGEPDPNVKYELNLDSNFVQAPSDFKKPEVIDGIFYITNIEDNLEYAQVKHLRAMNRFARRINSPIRFLASVEGKVICYI